MNHIGIIAGGFTAYPALDIEETRRFYGEIFGLEEGMVSEYEGKAGWVEFAIPGGHTLAIAQANEQWQPNAGGGGLAFELEDLDAAVKKLEAAGVRILLQPQDHPICRMALISDPSGNTVALHQKKPNHPECSN